MHSSQMTVTSLSSAPDHAADGAMCRLQAAGRGDSYTPPVDWLRRNRLPLALAAGVLYVVVLPLVGWHWAQPVLLAGWIVVLYWLPGLDTFVRNFNAGYSERR